jgi:integrase
MARQPKLSKKTIKGHSYWYTRAGGRPVYFGKVTRGSERAARKQFLKHLQNLQEQEPASKGTAPTAPTGGMTAGWLMDEFLEWVRANRSPQSYATRRIYCTKFGKLPVADGMLLRQLPDDAITSTHLETFLAGLRAEGMATQTLRHAETSIRACWNWAAKHPSPTPHLPSSYRPFSAVERIKPDKKPLTEGDLITAAEIQALFDAATYDSRQFPNEVRKNPTAANVKEVVDRIGADKLKRTDGGSFLDLLRCYYATGCRTSELPACVVEDFQLKTQQVVLGRHKRDRTERVVSIRHITLNDGLFAIFKRRCQGKQPSEPIFVREDGRAWDRYSLNRRFRLVRSLATALGRKVREEITPYSFRDLWISESLMAGVDVVTVARMAGTSIAMIEKHYAHFSNAALHQAQATLDRARAAKRPHP